MPTWNRRTFLTRAALLGGGLWRPGLAGAQGLPEGALESEALLALPGKRPLLKRSFRPPNYETPLAALGEEATANDAFFVRYHHDHVPDLSLTDFRLSLWGDAAQTQGQLTMRELQRAFPVAQVRAVCQCAGNRRGLAEPHVPGVQWGVGAMGNARWLGVRLRDVLQRVGVKPGAVEVRFAGADTPLRPGTPPFIKSLPLDRAMADGEGAVLLAWQMNGAALPHLHGAPLRLVVPGWVAAYWMKHLTDIQIVSAAEPSFWMKTAYRLPSGLFPAAAPFPSQTRAESAPITSLVVNSLITSLADRQTVPLGKPLTLRGVAWDGGSGIAQVTVASGSGPPVPAELGPDHGRFSFRGFTHTLTPQRPGPLWLRCRARSQLREEQPDEPVKNPSGYHHNAAQRLLLQVVLLLFLLWPALASAQREDVRLRPGPNRELVVASCVVCHSLDYIQMNSRFLDRKGWEAVVRKMINVMGAPATPAQVPALVTYLVKAYGREGPP